MKKIFTLTAFLASTALVSAQGVYQIPNSDFEGDWTTQTRNKYTEETPDNWNSFCSAKTNGTTEMAFGSFFSPAQCGTLKKASIAHSGKGAAVITATKNMLGSISNGNLTTGIINMGSISAVNPENYNFSDMGNDKGNCKMAGLPDAVSFWVQFDSKDSSKGNASANFVLHTDAGYQDPTGIMGEDKEKASRIAKAYQEITPITEWKEYKVPFEYNENNLYQTYKGQKYILVSFSTNKKPGEGSHGDALIIDDIKLLYYSELATLTYDGHSIDLEANKTNYTVDAPYEESKLKYTSNGKGATIEKSYDEASAVLTITVEGNDISVNPSNKHEYTIQFKKSQPEITEFTNSLLVNVFGQYTEPTENTVQVIKEVDGSYSFGLKGFSFSGMPIGDITVPNLTVEDKGGEIIYTATNQMSQVGSMESLPITLTAHQKEDQLTADIKIPFDKEGEGADVIVTFLPAMEIDGNNEVTAKPARYNMTLSRTFPAGWSTVCLPYATTQEALGAKSVQAFESADQSGLNFKEVTEIDANQPYLIYFEQATSVPVYGVAEITSTTPVSVTKGNYTFTGSYAASVSMAGRYGVATVGDVQKIMKGGANSTLKATRAYFTAAGAQPEQVRINLQGEGGNGTTGIGQIENGGAATYDVFNLQGIQIKKGASSLDGLKPGIYVVNGKKVVIK